VAADLDLGADAIQGRIVDADPVVRSGRIEFENGVTASVVADDANVVELHGTAGTILMEQDGMKATLRARNAKKDLQPKPGVSGTTMAIQALMSLVQGSGHPQYGISHAVSNQEVLFGWLESGLAGGRTVQFPLPRRGRVITGRTAGMFA
jgi:hypothetical protein